MAAVLLLLTAFAMSAAFASYRAAARARTSSELSSRFQEARSAVAAEESLERKYRLEPSAKIRAAHAQAAQSLNSSLNSVRLTGSPEDFLLVNRMKSEHAQYLASIHRMFDAVDDGNTQRVLQIDAEEVDPFFERIEAGVNEAAVAHDQDAIQRLDDLGQVEGFLFGATPVVFGLGLLLLGIFWFILRGYRKRALAAQAWENQREKEAALAEIEHLKLVVEAKHQTLLIREAQQAQKSAEQANLAKTEFLSRMSHELRTPMNAILGFGQVLEMDASLTEEQHENITYILKGGGHLLTLINELLDVNRIEGGLLISTERSVSTREMFATALELLTPLLADRGIEVSELENCHGRVTVDPQRLKQILLNLLSNAIKYNRPGGRIAVRCEAVEGERYRLEVRDTGPGIAPEDLERIFKPFERLGAERTAVAGTGIGLTLCKRLVEAMKGTLVVESVLGEGSTFAVYLPAGAPESPTLPERPAAPDKPAIFLQPEREPLAPGRRHTLLYIEDDPSNQELLRLILQERPEIQLSVASQGRLGLQMAECDRPDLIVLDLQLPDMPGLTVLAELRQNLATAHTPVLILSADATRHAAEQLLAAGATDFVAKPFNVSELLGTVDHILSAPVAG